MGSRRKAFISARGTSSYRAWMSDESPSCRLGVQIRSLITIMYLTFRKMKSRELKSCTIARNESTCNFHHASNIDAWVLIRGLPSVFAATAFTILIWRSVFNLESGWTSPSVRRASVATFHYYPPTNQSRKWSLSENTAFTNDSI